MTKQEFINNNLFRFIGCNCYSDCPTTKSADNLYLIGLEYFGRYEDDDCYFSYVNAETGEITSNSWSTRGACPHFNTYLRPTVKTAVENGWLSKEWYEGYVETHWRDYKLERIHNLTRYLSDLMEVFKDDQLSLPVEISKRCRKFKEPTGVLLSTERVRISYGWNNFETRAKVLGSDNKIYTIQLSSCTCSALADIRKHLTGMVDYIQDTKEIYDFIHNYNKVDITGCVDVEKEKAAAKEAEFKEKKMQELIEWCKSKEPEKSNEDIREWAEKIFNRKYVA